MAWSVGWAAPILFLCTHLVEAVQDPSERSERWIAILWRIESHPSRATISLSLQLNLTCGFRRSAIILLVSRLHLPSAIDGMILDGIILDGIILDGIISKIPIFLSRFLAGINLNVTP